MADLMIHNARPGARSSLRAIALALLAGLTLAGCRESASDQAFGAKVRAYLVAHPEVLLEAQEALDKKQQALAQVEARKTIEKIRAAIPSHRAQIERDPMDFVANPNGKITVTEFFDFRCVHCRNILPDVMALIADNPDVRFVFKDMPIFGAESDQAAALALAAKPDNKYLPLYQAFFAAQDLTPTDLQRIVAAQGLDYAKVWKRATDPKIAAHIQANQKLAQTMGIEGTPHFIVGDEVVVGEDRKALAAAVEKARKAAA